jgi:sugar/nucleoside kinase (ribokinase family)
MRLLIIGSVALDNVETPFGKVEDALGGSAVYASLAASIFCDKVSIVGVVGEDFPQKHIELLHRQGIDTQGLEIVDGKTFRWSGRYENPNEAITLQTSLNVFANFSPKISETYRSYEYLLLGNIDPDLQIKVLNQMERPEIIAADTMNFWIEGKNASLRKLLKMIDILFINEEEIKMLTGERYIFDAAKKVLQMGPNLVIIKRGEYGSLAIKKDFCFFAPIFPTEKVMDTTGAGDSFSGGFMGYIASQNCFNEEILKQAIIYGTIASSFDVEGFSVEVLKKIDRKQIDYRYQILKKYTQFE